MPKFQRWRPKAPKVELVRMYGYFECSDCDRKWQSAFVYCAKGTFQAAYGQKCQGCNEMRMPYLVEWLKCGYCGKRGCSCKKEGPTGQGHRDDLCGKCLAGRHCPQGRNVYSNISYL